ncbi:nucleotide-diphospho-sugar transferases superfamily protein [Actinidia rufa]|uniref:Nucleotide-diphospho-sugar transferases superfamily protein n=1 Tax=Actinidia rufa TaxID=165716 RepID=A0A7J0FWU3_9ERIC|nr:nucleotide-diphospho-sugar transferases superfamily protein [Actinidia rufa]
MSPRTFSSSSTSTATGGDADSWAVRGLVTAGAALAAAVAGAYVAFSLRRSPHFRRQVVGIIPARYASSRFQGIPLFPILGKPMIQHTRCLKMRLTDMPSCEIQRTWERANIATTLDQLVNLDVAVGAVVDLDDGGVAQTEGDEKVVATDDEKIAECCRGFGAHVIRTSESCRNGTECCNEALQKLQKKFDIVVNIQGDEPLIEPEIIDGVVKSSASELLPLAAPDAVFSTAVTSLKPEDASDPNRVKCVVDNHGYAIYFSRGLIPYNKLGKVNPHFPYLLHLGIQSYDAQFLRIYPDLSPTPLQLEEDLEQLKILENGYKMKASKPPMTSERICTGNLLNTRPESLRAELP